MNKVLVMIDGNSIYFSKYTREISVHNLNNTNVINAKNLKFTEEYIKENIDLISTFFNLLILKFKVDSVVIKDLEIAETIVSLVNSLNNIKSICFTEDNSLNYTISSLLLQNRSLQKIECYNLPEIMFYKFDEDIIKTRSEILSISSFFNYNNIKTYSDIYNKKSILISNLFNEHDIDDLKYFFETNKNLKRVEFKPYNRINLETILKIIKRNNLKKVCIVIYEENNTTQQILNDIGFFEKLKKTFEVDIKIKYSKEYREKNKIKELNIIMLRNLLLIFLILVVCVICLVKYKESKDNKNIDVNLSIIESAIEDYIETPIEEEQDEIEQNQQVEYTYISPYYTNYELVYNKLLELNDDTIGWLQVKNTKINYPVVQADNNDYYLNHAFDKTKNGAGWVFVDYRSNMDEISKNTIIYAHDVKKNNLMFGSLKNVLDDNWNSNYDNLIINFNIKGTTYNWQIFSIYTTEVTNDYLVTNFGSDYSFREYINKSLEKSIKNFNIEVLDDDKIITLSTCYNDANYRLVVQAKMIK